MLDEAGGQAQAAEKRVDDDAGDGAHFAVEEGCAEALIEAFVAVGKGDAAEGAVEGGEGLDGDGGEGGRLKCEG